VQNPQNQRRAGCRIVNEQQAETRWQPKPERIRQQVRPAPPELSTQRQTPACIQNLTQQSLRHRGGRGIVERPFNGIIAISGCLRRKLPEPA
jgi:hypothetical protein